MLCLGRVYKFFSLGKIQVITASPGANLPLGFNACQFEYLKLAVGSVSSSSTNPCNT